MKDDGVGFPESTAKREGMGVRIMHHRASIIGGVLEIQRGTDGGTIVTCSVQTTDILQETPTLETASILEKARILVVEDEPAVAEAIQDMLKHLGYSVAALVASGEEAIEKVAETHPDLVLMDIMLAGDMNGMEATAKIYDRFNIPVVYLTGYADDNILQRAASTEPFFGYVLKPFTSDDLDAAIKIALFKSYTNVNG